MDTLYLDLETFSNINLKTQGTYRYCEDVEILLFAFAMNDGPVHVWDCTINSRLPDKLKTYLGISPLSLCAHNSAFDRVVLENTLPEYFLNALWRDTMIRARAHSLPGGLDFLCEIFKLPLDKAKNKEGKKLMQLFCKPQGKNRKLDRCTRKTHPERWKEFIEYARLDVEAMRVLDSKLPKWNDTPQENALWKLDRDINDRGFAVDIELAEAAIELLAEEKVKRDKEVFRLTDSEVSAATQRDKLLKYMLEIHGIQLPNMQVGALNRRLQDPNLPNPVKELIRIRIQSSKTSTKKYKTLLNSVCSDNRLKGTLLFNGAPRTGRWSARTFQPHNLPRPAFKSDEIDIGIDAIKNNYADLIYSNITDMASSALRGVILSDKGKKLCVSDLKSIEGRVLAWLAGEQWKIDAYCDFDKGIGYDMYVLTYARTFNIDPAFVSKSRRQLGKVLELAMGYGGGVGAFVTFAKGYNIDLKELADKIEKTAAKWSIKKAENFYEYALRNGITHSLSKKIFIMCDAVKRMWRQANPAIVTFWSDLEDCDRASIYSEGGRYPAGHFCEFDKKGSWIRIRLPSGRYLCYAGAKIIDNEIRYLGLNTYTRKWGTLSTYGGKLAENVTQAVSRDVLANGALLCEALGYHIVLSIHDELLTEVLDTNKFTHEELSKIISTVPPWAIGLPLAAEGFESYRYRKG